MNGESRQMEMKRETLFSNIRKESWMELLKDFRLK